MTTNNGFTFIELVIVVFILGIIAVIALPAYQSYTNQARFTEVSASRKFIGPGQYPPENFLAYGILAFPQRATPNSK